MYTPKLSEDLVRALYQMKLRTKKPMTKLLNEAVREFLTIREGRTRLESKNQLNFLQLNISKTKK